MRASVRVSDRHLLFQVAPFSFLFGRVLGVGGSLVQLRAGFGGRFGAVGASAPPVGDSGREGLRGEAQNHTQK